jgi:hypothetical protein
MPKAKLAIHVAWSPLSQRFYAFRAYKRVNADTIEVTGEKFDVTDEIAAAILKYQIEFKAKEAQADCARLGSSGHLVREPAQRL